MRERHPTEYFETVGMLLIGFSIYELIFKKIGAYSHLEPKQINRWLEKLLGPDLMQEILARSISVPMIFFIVGALFSLEMNERRFQKYVESGDHELYKNYTRTRYVVYFVQAAVTVMAFILYGFDNALCLALGFWFVDMKHL